MEPPRISQNFVIGIYRIAADRKLMRDFDPDLVKLKIKKLEGFKEAICDEHLLETLFEDLAQWRHKKNMYVVLAIVKELHSDAAPVLSADGGADGQANPETTEQSQSEETAEDSSEEEEDDEEGQQFANGVGKYSSIIGRGIGIPALMKKVRNSPPVKQVFARAENFYLKVVKRIFLIRKSLLKAKATWDESAAIALEKAMQKTQDQMAIRPLWYIIWILLKTIHYILAALLIIARPWTLLEKLGVDPDEIPVPE